MPKSKPVTYYSWNIERAKFDQLRAALDVIDWSAVLNSCDVDTAVATWSNLVLSCVQKFVPLKKHCHQPNNRPWYSHFLHKIDRLCDRMYMRSRVFSRTSEQWSAYKRVRNWYVAELWHAEQSFYRSMSATFGHGAPSASTSRHWWSAGQAQSCCQVVVTRQHTATCD